MKNIFEKGKQNWFQAIVIILLVLCYVRLGKIKENTFYTADMVDASATRVINSTVDYLCTFTTLKPLDLQHEESMMVA